MARYAMTRDVSRRRSVDGVTTYRSPLGVACSCSSGWMFHEAKVASTLICFCRCPPTRSTQVMFPEIGPIGGLAMNRHFGRAHAKQRLFQNALF